MPILHPSALPRSRPCRALPPESEVCDELEIVTLKLKSHKAGARVRFIGGGHDGIVEGPPSAPHTPQPLAVAAFGERVKNAFEHGQGTYG
jgi:hypothetical protein